MCVCLLVMTLSPTKLEMPFGLWIRVGLGNHVLGGLLRSPRERDNFGGCSPFNALDCLAANAAAAQGCRLVHRGQRVTLKTQLQNRLTRHGGDKCGGDAAFHENSTSSC